MLLNLVYLTSPELYAGLSKQFDQHSGIKLGHWRFDHMGPLLECLFEKSVDLMILEDQYLRHKTEKVMELLPQYKGLKLLIAEDPKKVFFAFKMNINRCSSSIIDPEETKRLIRDCLNQKQLLAQGPKPFEKKIILPHRGKDSFRVIHWKDLISFQKKKKQTLIHQTQNISFIQPMSYEEVLKRNLPKTLFFELRPGYTVNLNHLMSIEFLQNNYYHCKLSDGRMVEINSSERTKILRFLENEL